MIWSRALKGSWSGWSGWSGEVCVRFWVGVGCVGGKQKWNAPQRKTIHPMVSFLREPPKTGSFRQNPNSDSEPLISRVSRASFWGGARPGVSAQHQR